MKRFAANRVYKVSDQSLQRNQVVEVDECTHEVLSIFTLEEEIRHTEWLGGIIIVAPACPARIDGEKFESFLTRLSAFSNSLPLHAYHITAFDVNSMEFTVGSRMVIL